MYRSAGRHRVTRFTLLITATTTLALAGPVASARAAATTVTATPAAAPPGASITVRGSGFAAAELVDVYVGTTDVALAVTDGGGAFSAAVTVPRTTPPGPAWVTAAGRHSGLAAQKSITVRTNWTQFGGGAAHRGVNTYENVLSPTTVGGLDEAWSVQLGPIDAPVTMAGSVTYVGGGTDFYALTGAGAVKWTYHVGQPVTASAAVADGSVYFAGYDKTITAVQAATGAFEWSYPTLAYETTSPTVAGGLVYFGSGNGNVYAFDAATGAIRWSYLTGGPIDSSPAVFGGVVFVGSADATVYALDAVTGAKKWSFAADTSVASSPAVSAGVVYVSSARGTIYALSASTGARKWSYDTAAAGSASAVIAGPTVYATSFNGSLYALDSASGVRRWAYATGQAIYGPPTVANGVVYFASYDHNLYAVDAGNANRLWSADLGDTPGLTGPVVVDGAVTIGTINTGVLHRYTLQAGATPQSAGRPEPSRMRPDYSLAVGDQ